MVAGSSSQSAFVRLDCWSRTWRRSLCGFCITFALFGVTKAFGQTTAPVPRPPDPVAIENTNAAFSPSAVEVPQASPARPTFTMPAHIPPTGYLQFEQGFNQANDSPSGTNAQFALSQTTKIALTTRLLVQFITQPYTYNRVSDLPNLTEKPVIRATCRWAGRLSFTKA